jgi:hypothetical protein
LYKKIVFNIKKGKCLLIRMLGCLEQRNGAVNGTPPRTTSFGAQADAAIASYAEPDDRARLAGWISRYLACRPAERAK